MGLNDKDTIGSPRRRRAPVRALLAVVLALVAGLAQALGLGQIQVKSQPGEPLLAEIPIISGDASELERLQVRLASPETFRRVGLQPPDVAATGLQFTVAVDERGRPVVRVTSATPLEQPLLTFLLEVDWGEGRLVREYSALLASPSTVAATPAQPLQAPVVAEPDTIERVPDAGADVIAEPLPEPLPEPAAPAEAAAPAIPDEASDPAPVAAIPTPEPIDGAPAAPAAAAPAAAPAPTAGAGYAVRGGDTLSGIAAAMDRGGRSLDQTMLALLEANPEAFIGGNINRLRAGAVLRMPEDDEMARYSAGEAAAMVRQQVAQWRGAAAAPSQLGAAPASAVAPGQAAPATEADAVARAPAEPRLQIVPPASADGEGGTRTGIQAGGEGVMLQQQIQETQETLAARDAEVDELKARVAELETLQQQQQQLIALKDSALAAAQKKLAEGAAATAQPAGATPADNGPVWPWIVLPLLVLVAAAAWWLLRRPGAQPRNRLFPGGFTAASIRPSAPAPAAPKAEPAAVPAQDAGPPPAPSFARLPAADASSDPVPVGVRAPEPARDERELEPVLAGASFAGATMPHWTSAPALVGAPPVSPASAESAAAALAAGRDQATTPARQVELARAYLDLGDDGAARELLREVLDGRDPVARDIAARMLREL